MLARAHALDSTHVANSSDDNLPAVSRSRRPAVPGPGAALGFAKRLTATARNAAEVVRFGGLETDEAPSPFTVEAEQLNYRLRHYFAASTRRFPTPVRRSFSMLRAADAHQ